VVVDETLPASQVEAVIRQGGGKCCDEVRLFDVYRGEPCQIGDHTTDKKSLAYSLTYQAVRWLPQSRIWGWSVWLP
jgi:phenylalanyl-tRNA synthetase beta chain